MSQLCAHCGNPASEFQKIDEGLMKKLHESGREESIPEQVCSICFVKLAGSVARGSILVAREKAKEERKLAVWNSRTAIIKKARACLNEKAFSDAAVAYEKYIKILELVFDAKPGELNPEHFKVSARTKELTVVASVYWDLLRIYDTAVKYGDRQKLAAQKLATFLRYTPIYPDILRKAHAFSKTAKNPDVVKSFLKAADAEKGRCFIATAAFEYHSPEVERLSRFRDQYLLSRFWGRVFVAVYYRLSPPFARFLDKHPACRPFVRRCLRKLTTKLPG